MTTLTLPDVGVQPYRFDVESELTQLALVIASEDHFGEPEEVDALRWSAGQVRLLLARYQRSLRVQTLNCENCGHSLADMDPAMHKLGRIRYHADLCMSCYFRRTGRTLS